ncbi:MAG: flagellar hook-associated protein 1 FlgK [bacterium]|jgi:flagellar hook-associated protein 1 FlgK
MSIFTSFEIGKKALSASQAGQTSTGHNIANVDTKGFSRHEVSQSASRPMASGAGTGVEIDEIRRIHDNFTIKKIIEEQNNVGSFSTKTDILKRAEIIYTDLEGNGLRAALDEFWSAWAGIANQPESEALRTALLSDAQKLANNFRVVDRRISELRKDLNSRMEVQVLEVNDLAKKLAKLNTQVQTIEFQGGNANDFRDQRDLLLQEVSEKINIQWFEDDRSLLQVSLGNGQLLVDGRNANMLLSLRNTDGAELGMSDVAIRAKSGTVYKISDNLKGGVIHEYQSQRDGNLKKYQNDLNLMVRELAFQVNTIHATGTGIESARFRETSAYGLDANARNNPLPFLESGSFEIQLVNQDDNEISDIISIDLEAGTDTLDSVVEKINLASDAYEYDDEGNKTLKKNHTLKAKINEDGSVSLVGGLGKKFIFGEDQTNVLALMGFNAFFHVVDGAKDLRVNQELIENEMAISAGKGLLPGDNRVALDIASLQFKPIMRDETATFDEFYNAQVADVGLRVQRAQKSEANHQQILDQFITLRDSVSSVNLDEEMANMVKYQRAYESSARFMSTINEMTNTLVNM